MAIVVPRRIHHFQKPEGPVEIDWSKTPTSLSVAYIFNVGAGSPVDLVSGRIATLESSSWGTETAGRAIIHDDNATDTTVISDNSSDILSAQGITILMGYQKRDTTKRSGAAFGVASSTSANRCGTHHPFSDGVTYWDFGGTGGGSTRLSHAFLMSDLTSPSAYAFTTGSRGMEIWRNGRKAASNIANPSRNQTSAAFKLGLHGSDVSDTNEANFYYFYVFREQISESIISELTENVNSIYKTIKPRRRWVPVAIEGGAGSTVIPDNAAHGHVADTATLSQNHILILADASHGHIAEQMIITQSHLLAIAYSLHSQFADNVTLGQSHILSTDDALHGHSADPVVLDQSHILAVADALHAHAADNASLTVAGALEIASSIHGHTADQVALTQLHILAAANSLHGHSADNVTLTSGLTLDITDAIHGHTAGQVTIQQSHILAIVNSEHGHTAEQATLGVDLIIQPASHAHTADIVSLDPGLALAIQDAIHAHQSNNLTLNQQHILVISDALHNHLAQNVTVSEGAFTISTFPARTITVVGKSRTITVVAGNRTINA